MLLHRVESLCPYCRGTFNQSGNTVYCSVCKTLHHLLCWREHGQCSVYGCKGVDNSFDKVIISSFHTRVILLRVLKSLPILWLAILVLIGYLFINVHANTAAVGWVVLGGVMFLLARLIHRCPACGYRLEVNAASRFRNYSLWSEKQRYDWTHIEPESYKSCPNCGVRFLRGEPSRKQGPSKGAVK